MTAQKATIREEVKSIVTYPYSDPNPLPSFLINEKISFFYPYFMFDGFTRESINKQWKVITLENDFIEVTILPEVGGKVWGAIEKSTGRDFIYLNRVLKFRSIGIRGPWTSGGIEHNFGLDLGHAPWTASEVDYKLIENPDSSVSCIVGGIDLASRTQWRVEIRLPKDKACFETRSMWYNPTPLHDAYLSWENAAYKATDDLELYFPGTSYIGHGGDVNPWPVDNEGRKLSVYKENNFGTSKSYHVFGMLPNWFGGYYHDSGFGSGHWAPYDDAPGKKIWIWSLARDGAIWEDLLTDNDGQYIEAQSGVKFNQASPESGYNSPFDQLSLRPHYTETKSEFWFPVIGTKGIIDASANGTLNIVSVGDSIRLFFCPNVIIRDSLIVRSGYHIIYKSLLKLQPLQLYHKTISLLGYDNQDIKLTIGDDLLCYSSHSNDKEISRPARSLQGNDFNSAEHLFRVAEDMRSMRDYDKALEVYLACLNKEPAHSRALTQVAELNYRKGKFEEGLKYARKVLEINSYDGGANFVYAIIHKALGNLDQAEEAFSVASRTMEFRSGSYLQIAGLRLCRKDFKNAIIYAKKALDYNRFNIVAYEFLITSYRKAGMNNEALNTILALLEVDPLNHYAYFERYLLDPSSESLHDFSSGIKNELAYETYIELAVEYANQGLYDEAVVILEQSPEYPIVYYWLAYLNRKMEPDKSRFYLSKAVDSSPLMVFPFRLETIPVFIWAQSENPSWKNNYYLGLIYQNINLHEKAKELFSNCEDHPDFAYFYLARGILLQNDPLLSKSARKDFVKAKALAPYEWRTWHYLNTYQYSERNSFEMLDDSQKAFDMFPGNPVLGIDLAKALLLNEKHAEAIKVLKSLDILPFEGAREGYELYEMANLSLAVENLEKKKYKKVIEYLNSSNEYPENLGAGKPYEPDNRFKDYVASYCKVQLGDEAAANNYYAKIVDYSSRHWSNSDDPVNIYVAAVVLKAQGKNKELASSMKKWEIEMDSLRDWRITEGSSSPIAQWVLAKYYNEEAKALNLKNSMEKNIEMTKFKLFVRASNAMNLKLN
jgi:tetratricopeptide (TPR) repeat protein